MYQIEIKLFQELVQAMTKHIQSIQLNALLVAQLDCLVSFARTAKENNYALPKALVNIFGKPILYYLLDNLKSLEIDFFSNKVILESII